MSLPAGDRKFKILAIGYAAQPLLATKSILEDAGYLVITALGIQKALQTLNSAPADLVLLSSTDFFGRSQRRKLRERALFPGLCSDPWGHG